MTIDKIQGTFDWASVVKHFQALGGGLREIRLVRSKDRRKIDRYFVDSVDSLNNILPILQNLNHEGYEVYCSLNPLKDGVRQKSHDKCASDEDVLRREWILIDVDRSEGTTERAASEQELDQAKAIMTTIVDELVGKYPDLEPIVIGTGNGLAIWLPVQLENSDAASDQVGRLLGAIDRRFCEGTGFKVDQSVKNASRVARLAGTMNCKFEPRKVQLLLSGGRRIVLVPDDLESLIKHLDKNAPVAEVEVQELDFEWQDEPLVDDFDAEDVDQPVVANEDEKRITAYFEKALTTFRSTPSGKKHSERLRLSFRMGQLAAGHEVAYMRDEIITRLFDELPPEQNAAKELKTIKDGWSEGYAKPQRLPDKPSYSYSYRAFFDPAVIAEFFCKTAKQPVIFVAGQSLIYENGVYRELDLFEFEQRLTLFTEKHFASHREAEIEYLQRTKGGSAKPLVRQVTKSVLANVMTAVKARLNVAGIKTLPGWIRPEKNDWPVEHTIVCQNCLLNARTLETQPLTPRFASLGKSAAEWHGIDAAAPFFAKCLINVMPGDDTEAEKIRRNLLMYSGLLLLPDRRHHKILQLIGESRSGKSTFLDLLTSVIGE